MRRIPLRAAVVVVPLAALLAASQPFFAHAASSATSPVRIMPLGDSITGSPGCWRALLWQHLQQTGDTDVDFVGTQPPQGCGIDHDGDNEGHGGSLVTNVADQNQLPGWLSTTRPDIVLMHFGTNDVWSNRSIDTILAAFSKLVDQMRASNATTKIIVAQIIPMDPSSCPECGQRAVDLNNAIPGWASSKSTTQSPIAVVDQWTGFSTATDTVDGVHPNDSGNQKMTDRWYPALTAALDGTTPSGTTPGPSSSSASSSTTSSSPPAASSPAAGSSQSTAGGCSAAYEIVNQWTDGFQGEITVRNAGASTTVGFIASWNGSANTIPATACTAS